MSEPNRSPNLLTILAITIAAWLVWTVTHEVFGHATACIVAGGQPLAVTTHAVDCDTVGVSAAGLRSMYAAGSVANLLAALLAGLFLRSSTERSPSANTFLWLTVALHGLHAGTLMLDGPFGRNDWAGFLIGIPSAQLWNLVTPVIGMAVLVGAVRFLQRQLRNDGRSILSVTVVPLVTILWLNALGVRISQFDYSDELLFGAARQVWWLLLFPIGHLALKGKSRAARILPWLGLAVITVLFMRLTILGYEASSILWVLTVPALLVKGRVGEAKIRAPARRDDLWLIVGAFSLVVYLMLARGLGAVGGVQLY